MKNQSKKEIQTAYQKQTSKKPHQQPPWSHPSPFLFVTAQTLKQRAGNVFMVYDTVTHLNIGIPPPQQSKGNCLYADSEAQVRNSTQLTSSDLEANYCL